MQSQEGILQGFQLDCLEELVGTGEGRGVGVGKEARGLGEGSVTLYMYSKLPQRAQNGSPWLWLEVKKSDISPTSEDAWAERGP